MSSWRVLGKGVFLWWALALAGGLLASQSEAASGFGAYTNGLLKIIPPDKVRIYRQDSTTSHRTLSAGSASLTVTDARWQGEDLAVYLLAKDGKQRIRLYISFSTYKNVN